jgi:hypothetical protein
MHIYEIRPRKDQRGVDLISDALPFGRLWYGEPNAVTNAIGYAEHRSRSRLAVIRVYDEASNVIEDARAAIMAPARVAQSVLTSLAIVSSCVPKRSGCSPVYRNPWRS